MFGDISQCSLQCKTKGSRINIRHIAKMKIESVHLHLARQGSATFFCLLHFSKTLPSPSVTWTSPSFKVSSSSSKATVLSWFGSSWLLVGSSLASGSVSTFTVPSTFFCSYLSLSLLLGFGLGCSSLSWTSLFCSGFLVGSTLVGSTLVGLTLVGLTFCSGFFSGSS